MKKIGYIILFIFSCQRSEKINFVDSTEVVNQSMKSIIVILGKTRDSEMRNFFLDNDTYFYINNNKIGRFDRIKKDEVIRFFDKDLTDVEFNSLHLDFNVLKKNNISSVFYDPNYNQVFFTYNTSQENTFNQLRILTLNIDFNGFDGQFQVLDRKSDIYLLRLTEK
jgi:hypothetical protein